MSRTQNQCSVQERENTAGDPGDCRGHTRGETRIWSGGNFNLSEEKKTAGQNLFGKGGGRHICLGRSPEPGSAPVSTEICVSLELGWDNPGLWCQPVRCSRE